MKLFSTILFALLLNACCYESSNFKPWGYPFDPDITELNELDYSEPIGMNDTLSTSSVIRDTATAMEYFKYAWGSTFTNSVDYSKYDVIRVRKTERSSSEVLFQIRVLINHKTRTLFTEINTKSISCILSTVNGNVDLDKYIKIPKIPVGYTFVPSN